MNDPEFKACFNELRDRVSRLEKSMSDNTAMTTEVRDLLVQAKGLGSFAKWFLGIALTASGLWAALFNNKPPH